MDDSPPPPRPLLISRSGSGTAAVHSLSLFYPDINIKYTVFFSLEAPTFFNFYFLPQDNFSLLELVNYLLVTLACMASVSRRIEKVGMRAKKRNKGGRARRGGIPLFPSPFFYCLPLASSPSTFAQ